MTIEDTKMDTGEPGQTCFEAEALEGGDKMFGFIPRELAAMAGPAGSQMDNPQVWGGIAKIATGNVVGGAMDIAPAVIKNTGLMIGKR